MNTKSFPSKQGLYDPTFEHDACGIGFIANIKGEKSNRILRDALTALKNLSHRGGLGSEPTSGDGAGILLQIPHSYYKKVCASSEISLPEAGDYGAGIVFLPHDGSTRAAFEKEFERVVTDEGQSCLGFRDVPVDSSMLGRTAERSMPYMRQIFIGRRGVPVGMDFERKLYVIRRRIENAIHRSNPGDCFYLPSLSSRTIVYKGMLTAEQLDRFYIDLQDDSVVTALALIHSRYSTNTFPSWERAHPNRCIIHNGEINTLRGNVNFMNARESILKSDTFGADLKKALPVIDKNGSDSSMFDNTAEFLMLSGMPIERVLMLMIPEPWSGHESMSAEKKAFYEYSACLMEPWDGPAAMGFTDGVRIGAVLDRNGLRPSRYYVTTDDTVILASEVGVLDIAPEKVIRKERLHPGRMLLVDTEKGRIIEDDEIKHEAASGAPYAEWLQKIPGRSGASADHVRLPRRQPPAPPAAESLRLQLRGHADVPRPHGDDGRRSRGFAMGNDTPLAVLSKKPMLLYDYFKQLFSPGHEPAYRRLA